ncbi:hypothetical protein A2U01_0038963, partial [Trifolium medium]|nr:hypothetical protein [Trifolium medium]
GYSIERFIHSYTRKGDRKQNKELNAKGRESESTTTEETKVDAHQLFEESTGVVISSLFSSFV